MSNTQNSKLSFTEAVEGLLVFGATSIWAYSESSPLTIIPAIGTLFCATRIAQNTHKLFKNTP